MSRRELRCQIYIGFVSHELPKSWCRFHRLTQKRITHLSVIIYCGLIRNHKTVFLFLHCPARRLLLHSVTTPVTLARPVSEEKHKNTPWEIDRVAVHNRYMFYFKFDEMFILHSPPRCNASRAPNFQGFVYGPTAESSQFYCFPKSSPLLPFVWTIELPFVIMFIY